MELPGFLKIGDEVAYHLFEKVVGWFMSLIGFSREKPTSTSSSEPDQSRQRRDWLGVFMSNKLTDVERNVLRVALDSRPADQDRFEKAMGQLFSELRDGVFSQENSKIVEKFKRPIPGKKGFEEGERTIETKKSVPGFSPKQLVIEMLKNACKNPENASLFIDLLLQKSLGQHISEQFKKRRQKIIWTGVGIIAFWVSGIGIAVHKLVQHYEELVNNPTDIMSFVWGTIWFGIFAIFATPVAKAFLPKKAEG